jgi:hypothetical protein
MLLNEGRHPETNENVIPSEIVKDVATGVSVSDGEAAHPELVSHRSISYTTDSMLTNEKRT